MVCDDDVIYIGKSVTLNEIRVTLDHFAKDKSPGPNGWTTKKIVGYFDLVREDLLKVVEEPEINGYIRGTLNVIFISLIPKFYHPKNF